MKTNPNPPSQQAISFNPTPAKAAPQSANQPATKAAPTPSAPKAQDQHSLEGLGQQGKASTAFKLTPELEIKGSPQKVQVSGFPPGNPPPFEDILSQVFPQAKSVVLMSKSSQHPFNTATYQVDGKPVEISFLYGGIMPGKVVTITPLKGDLPPFQENKPADPEQVLTSPEDLFPSNTQPHFKVSAQADGSYDLRFARGAYPSLESVVKEIFPDAKQFQLLSQDHTHPFSRYTFSVDNKTYEYSYLTGGIVASEGARVTPLDE